MSTPPRTICLVAFLSLTSVLSAADSNNSWYFNLDAGVALTQDTELETGILWSGPFPEGTYTLTFDPGVRFDLAGGYRFARHWAVELEAGFVYNAFDLSGLDFSDSLYQVPIFANVVYQFPLHERLRMQLGLGLGAVGCFLDLNALNEDESTFEFGLQAFAGLVYELKPNMDLGLGYRFLTTATQDYGTSFFPGLQLDPTYTHAVTVQFRFKF